MIVYPAMDLMGGRCVRLAHGRFDEVSDYLADPVEAVLGFEEAGAEWVHVVDLDGAREGGPRQHGLIVDIALSVSMKLQVAGGFRTSDHLKRMFDAGVDRVALGSLAVTDPPLVRRWIERFGPGGIVIALDVSLADGMPHVVTADCTRRTGRTLWDVAAHYPDARHLLITDIGSDGMTSGPNLALIEEAATRFPDAEIQASGGVSSLDDLSALAAAGAAGAIVGKALSEGRIRLEEALQSARA